MITLENIARKMGCEDPFHPPRPEHDGWAIDDATPSPYSVLTQEERAFLIEKQTAINLLQR